MVNDTERLTHLRGLLRVLLAPSPLGVGPIRMEAWGSPKWTQEQREAFEELRRKVAG